ncbi:MAG TPA: SUMF1/EgtB/PvdO family nonheme iron enzyme [Lacunisphaera sp.]|nr:SUMF1/EgtB/PvdO family nonheme iron enzyme [Lacunisphaera sp.]
MATPPPRSSVLLKFLLAATLGSTSHATMDPSAPGTNSLGMALVKIEPGSFDMGVDSTPLPLELTKGVSGASWDRTDRQGDYDEVPVHRVTITRPFLIGETEVTVQQYRQFRPDYQENKFWSPAVAGISWQDAEAFCEWLSRKEGKPYRLPTEAEWEYVCRAGSRTLFSAGAEPAPIGVANAWGVKNMQASVPEWCLDWHGRYPAAAQTDPVGPASGYAKVVRGGGHDHRASPRRDGGRKFPAEQPYYRRSANRASAAPDFHSPEGHIGFRVVQATLLTTRPTAADEYFFQTAIKQHRPDLTRGPDMAKPFYRQRPMFPNLGEHRMHTVGWKIGFMTGLGQVWHNTAVQVLDNGDLVAAYYNVPQWENEVDQSIATLRLRHGADEWDMPEPWPDFVDAADTAPLFWNDHGKLWLFWGLRSQIGGPPFQFMTSTDNGATWSGVTTPVFEGKVGDYTPQPVNSIVRDASGTFYVPVDGDGNTTGLWATSNEGKTWRDTGGRSGGRHTTFVMARDGSIIGYGGKNSNVEGTMPLSVTRDGGQTYAVTKTEFKPLAGGQRPSIIRLQSGRLFFVADTLSSRVPGGRQASYVALSDDDGKTWQRRDLPIASTVGYVTATQAPNGVIHIVTSKTKPAFLHIELNETWVLQGGAPTPVSTAISDAREDTERFPNGRLKARWQGGTDADGNYRLHGPQVFYYEDGGRQWESNYRAGKRTGTETYWNRNGTMKWQRIFSGNEEWTWRVFDAAGHVTAESKWKGKNLVDPGIRSPEASQ